jgi:hypothetical protein
VPFDETVVKVPPSWPLATGNAAPSWTNATVGEVWTFQTVIWAVFAPPPPLLTTRPDAVWTGEVGRPAPAIPYFFYVEYVVGASGRKSAKLARLSKNILPVLPAVAARCGNGPGWAGERSTPPDPRSLSLA